MGTAERGMFSPDRRWGSCPSLFSRVTAGPEFRASSSPYPTYREMGRFLLESPAHC